MFDPLDFLAEVSAHIPDAHEKTTLFYGWYSNRTRGYRKGVGQHALLELARLSQRRRDGPGHDRLRTVSGFLWDATRRNATYTAGALNLQAVTAFIEHTPDMDGRIILSDDPVRDARARYIYVDALLAELAPRQRAAIQRVLTATAKRVA